MDIVDTLPPAIKIIHESLEPYIKQRQEASSIRQKLAASLQVSCNKDGSVTLPLSLPSNTVPIEVSRSSFKGTRKDYIRAASANVRARDEYERVKRQHQAYLSQVMDRSAQSPDLSRPDDGIAALASLLEISAYQRRHERLRIIQESAEMLAKTQAASINKTELGDILKDMEPMPKVPEAIVSSSGPRDPAFSDLSALVSQLEKSVLRAKLLLQREQTLLAKIRNKDSSKKGFRGKLQALVNSRNELINWIELELGKTSESAPDEGAQSPRIVESGTGANEYIQSQILSIQERYLQYTTARKKILLALNAKLKSPAPTALDNGINMDPETDGSEKLISSCLHPYLEELVAVAAEQKSVIQQKSFLTASLSRHLKEAGRGLDRLFEESHLLSDRSNSSDLAHCKAQSSFADDVSNNEKPHASKRAGAWVAASDSASLATRTQILEKLEEGEVSISEAQSILLDIERLLVEQDVEGNPVNPWERVDGNLGAIETLS